MYLLGAMSLLALSSLSKTSYRMRPFDPSRDQPHLEEICRNVFDGTDYLPSVARSLASDPLSTFVVLANDDDDQRPVAAVANLRRFLPGKMWLEAVRTCETRRNRGLARTLTTALIDQARAEGSEVLTCTVESNVAMRRVMEGAGMRNTYRIHQCSFDKMKVFPGWGAGDGRKPRPMLQELEAEHLITEEARELKWEPVESRDDLNDSLERIRMAGGHGYVPGLWELLGDETIEESLRSGLVFKLRSNREDAVLTLFRDKKIVSLQSKWVCSVATCSPVALEAALWHTCSQEFSSLLEGDVAFALAVDGSIPTEIPICGVLPLVENAYTCLVYSTEPQLK